MIYDRRWNCQRLASADLNAVHRKHREHAARPHQAHRVKVRDIFLALANPAKYHRACVEIWKPTWQHAYGRYVDGVFFV